MPKFIDKFLAAIGGKEYSSSSFKSGGKGKKKKKGRAMKHSRTSYQKQGRGAAPRRGAPSPRPPARRP